MAELATGRQGTIRGQPEAGGSHGQRYPGLAAGRLRKRRFGPRSTRSWLTFWFIIIALVPIVAVITPVYFQRESSIKAEASSKLTAIRDLKVRKVSRWFEERTADLRIFTEILPDMQGVLHHPVPAANSDGVLAEARSQLSQRVHNFPVFRELFIVDAKTGTIVVATEKSREGMFVGNRPFFADVLSRRDLVISTIRHSQRYQSLAMELSMPLLCRQHGGRHLLAVLVAGVAVNSSFFPLLQDRTGMGRTGETFIVSSDGLALSELRWHEQAPLRLRFKALPVQLAAQGETGVVEAPDYRGVDVLAAYTQIPETGWVFIAKQDLAELHAPISAMVWEILSAMLVVIVVASAAGTWLAGRMSRPITETALVARQIQKGDVSARCAVEGTVELEALGQAINSMAEGLLAQADIQRTAASVSEILVAASSRSEFATQVLTKLMEVTGSDLGAVYQLDEQGADLVPVASVGIAADLLEPFSADKAEGQLGRALVTHQITYIKDPAESTSFRFKTIAGVAIPREIVTVPLPLGDRVMGLFALATLTGYSPTHREILQRLWMVEQAAYANLLATEQTAALAAKLQQSNTELLETNAQLRSQSAELREKAHALKALAAKLEAQRAKVEEADRLKSEFLSNMSHELRTPLNSVLALSQLMISRGPSTDPTEDRELLSIIERNGRLLLELINDILDLSRIEAGRVELRLGPMQAATVVHGAVEAIRSQADAKGLLITVSAADVPELRSDEQKVRQILLNLLSNAVKFTSEGRIEVLVSADQQEISFAVRDTGIGIAPADQERIFEEFRQLDGTTTRAHGGTGLGLAICRKLARLLGGTVTVASTPQRGSTFTLTLPLDGAVAPAGDDVAQPDGGTLGEGDSSAPLVLVIDDDPETCALLREHLESGGYQVAVATSGRQGLLLAQKLRPLAVTLDVLMPSLDGWEVLRELKAHPETAAIPVIMVSITSDQATGLALGAVGYLVKPIRRSELLAELDRVAVGRRIRHVLVVDDDADTRAAYSAMLAEHYPSVRQAAGGQEALAIATSELPPDVVILDLMMPDMDGFATLDELRRDQRTRDLPVIIVTAKDLTHEDRARLSAGVWQIIQKDGAHRQGVLADIRRTLRRLEKRLRGRVPDSRSPGGSPSAPRLDGRPPARSRPQNGPARVLVVEDNPDNMVAISALLKGRKLRCLEAENCKEAMDLARGEKPDLILMDIQLPHCSGLDLTRRMKTDPQLRDTPVVALTAHAMSGDRDRILSAGCDDYLTKPIVAKELDRVLAKWLTI